MEVLIELENYELDLYGSPPTMSGGGGAVDSVNTQTGVVVLDQDDIADGTTYKQYSQTEKTKLAGIATGATANDTDANLLNRANHTGTQTVSTISDFTSTLNTALADVGQFARPFNVAVNDYFLTTVGLGTAYSAAGVSSTAANSTGKGKITPFYIATPTEVDALALYCVAGNSGAGAVIRLGIYDDLDGRPNNPVIDANTASINSPGMKTLTFTPVTLQPGHYWAGGFTQNLDTAAGNPTFACVTGTQTIGEPTPAASNNMFPLAIVTNTGALTTAPAFTLSRVASATVFHIWLRRSA